MNSTNHGGPAFPRPTSEDRTQGDQHDGNRTVDDQVGMSLRDYFAAAALTGLLAGRVRCESKAFAEQAYELADAMLAHRLPAKGGAA